MANSISIVGSLGKDAVLKKLGEHSVLNFSIADNQHQIKGKEQPPIWWNCQLWGKPAEALATYLLKGTSITVFGQVSEREYKASSGEMKKAFDVRVNQVAFHGSSKQTAAKDEEGKPAPAADDFDDIPF